MDSVLRDGFCDLCRLARWISWLEGCWVFWDGHTVHIVYDVLESHLKGWRGSSEVGSVIESVS
jgi:hypothetical protein